MNSIKFSIIVPVFHEGEKVNELIGHLHHLDPEKNLEIIVVDGSLERDTLGAIDSNHVIKISSEKGRGKQMNIGGFCLVKGSDEYPTPFVYAWRREPMPPFQVEDWKVKRPYGRDMKYAKVRVADHRPVADWAWNIPVEDGQKSFIVVGPYPVSPSKVSQFIAALPANEWWWRESLAQHGSQIVMDPATRAALDRTFPRTFQCYTYGSRCSSYPICFGSGWSDRFKTRTPHHSTEEM